MKKKWTASQILSRAAALNISLEVVSGNLHIQAAPGVLTPVIREMLRDYKTELIAALIATNTGDGAIRDAHVPLSRDEMISRIAAVFPGGCQVHRDPPGYTLADRVREIEAQNRAKH